MPFEELPTQAPDLFGKRQTLEVNGPLAKRFMFPPFTVLNAREGLWQSRKKQWEGLGIQSEVGRGANVLGHSPQSGNISFYKLKRKLEEEIGRELSTEEAQSILLEQGKIGHLDSGAGRDDDLLGYSESTDAARYDKEEYRNRLRKQTTPGGGGGPNSGYNRGAKKKADAKAFNMGMGANKENGWKVEDNKGSGTSIFDPVLCEVMYDWFSPRGGVVLDPFAGGSVRGIVASWMGRKYWGCDLRPEQIEANKAQMHLVPKSCPKPTWIVGDSCEKVPQEAPDADFVFACHPAGTRVRLASGILKDIDDIVVGDSVVTHTGQIKKVYEKIRRTYTGKIYTIKRDYRSVPVRATAEHPFFVCRGGIYVWINAEDIKLGDELVEPVKSCEEKNIDGEIIWSHTEQKLGRKAKGNSHVVACSDAARLIGYFLAEGWTSGNATMFAFHEDEQEYQDDVSQLVKRLFGEDLSITKTQGNGKAILLTCSSAKVSQFFMSNCGSGAAIKKAPRWLFESSENCIKEMVKGYWRGDGWAGDGPGAGATRFSMDSVSEQLIEDIRLLLLKVGIVASVRRRIRKPNEYCKNGLIRPLWSLTVRGIYSKKMGELLGENWNTDGIENRRRRFGFRESRSPRIENGFVHYPVRSISFEEVNSLQVFNMEVEDDHSYIAEGVASHNCPPYFDLEVYSDDPRDLSAMEWDKFRGEYNHIIASCVERLRNHRFAAFVIGDVRDQYGCYRNLPGFTTACFKRAGMELYNEMILVTMVGSLPIRTLKQFTTSRKFGKTHQNVLIYVKGDPRKATDAVTNTSMEEREEDFERKLESRHSVDKGWEDDSSNEG